MTTASETALYGTDIWLGTGADGVIPNTQVSRAGDYVLVTGREAVEQNLWRRFLSNPGEWKTKPDYGAGVKAFVKSRMSSSHIDQLKTRIQEQAMKVEGVASVSSVDVTLLGDNAIKLSVTVFLKGDGKPLTTTGTVT